MPSPFPGMDPYLEEHWRDVHSGLIIYMRDQLQPKLPSDLRARVEERVVVGTHAGETRGVFPDVRVFETERGATGAQTVSEMVAAEPLLIEIVDEPRTETFVQVHETGHGHRLVTVIEVLSETNKLPLRGSDQYLQKQKEVIAARVNLVEIDLLRTGMFVLAVPRELLPAPRAHYMACVRRACRPTLAEVYSITLRAPLPVLRIPLREADPDVLLDLQSIIAECWSRGGYDDIDYSRPPDPPLDPADAAWARELAEGWARRA